MLRIVDGTAAGQLDVFGPERMDLVANFRRMLDAPNPESIDRIRHGLAVLRTGAVIDLDTVDVVDNYLDELPSLVNSTELPREELAEAACVGIDAAAIVIRAKGLPKQQKGKLYVRSDQVMTWLEDQGAMTHEQLALPAAGVGTMFGNQKDLTRAYSYLDLYIRERRHQLESNLQAPLVVPTIRLRRALTDLAVKDKSERPAARMHKDHLNIDEVVGSRDGYVPSPAHSTLELLRIIDIIEKKRPLAGRVLQYALGIDIQFDQKLVSDVLIARRTDAAHTSLFRYVSNQLAA